MSALLKFRLLVCSLALAFMGLGLGMRTLRYGDPSALVGFGCRPVSPCLAQENRPLLPHPAVVFTSGGYDGQFFYYNAAALVLGKAAVLDDPVLRRSRIGFSWMLALFGWLGEGRGLLGAVIWLPLLLHILCVFWVAPFFLRGSRLGSFLLGSFVFSPLALLSAGLGVADGIALELALLALLFAQGSRGGNSSDDRLQNSRQIFRTTLAMLLMTLALLSKETALAFYPLYILWTFVGPRVGRSFFLKILNLACAGLPGVSLLLWWGQVGFVPWQTAGRHAGLPFQGFWNYLQNPDALLSGRGVLSLLLIVFVILFFYETWHLGRKLVFVSFAQSRKLSNARKQLMRVLLSGQTGLWLLLFLNLGLIGAATQEYWMNFANIGRLFTPLSFYPVLRQMTSPKNTDTIWERWMRLLASALLLLLAWVVFRELALEPPLTVEIWP